MRTFIDMRYYIKASENVTAQTVADQIASNTSDVARWKVDGYRMLQFGAEEAGQVVQLGHPTPAEERN